MNTLLSLTKRHTEMWTSATDTEITFRSVDDLSNGCNLCPRVGIDCDCGALLTKSAILANNLKSGYCFLCHEGFSLFCAPVVYRGNLVGGYFSQPLVMDEKANYVDDVLSRHKNVSAKIVKEIVTSFDFVTPQRLRNLCDLLFALSGEYEADNAVNTFRQHEKDLRENAFGEQIQKLKSDSNVLDSKFFVETENELLNAIKREDFETSRSMLNTLLGKIFTSFGGNLAALKAKCIEIIVLVSHSSEKTDALNAFVFSKTALENLISLNDYDSMCAAVNNALKQYFSLAESQMPAKRTVSSAQEYVADNITKSLTLSDVANYVYLNPSYFSRLFKNETGKTFVDFVNGEKIAKAKTLLVENKMSAADISAELGFADQSYFNKIFKRYVGCTPKEWLNKKTEND